MSRESEQPSMYRSRPLGSIGPPNCRNAVNGELWIATILENGASSNATGAGTEKYLPVFKVNPIVSEFLSCRVMLPAVTYPNTEPDVSVIEP